MKTCSKCKEEKNLYEFTKNKTQPDGMQRYCKRCKKSSDRKWYEENPSVWKNGNAVKNEKIKNLISSIRQDLGGKCNKCNESREHLLDFHHVDPSIKEGTVTNILNYNGFGISSINKAKEEASKCILLCSNCHRDFHFLEFNNKITIKEYLNG
jgi:protein-arginine kinase activator protein McsA